MTGVAGQLLRDDVSLMREPRVIDFRFRRNFAFLRSRFLVPSLRFRRLSRADQARTQSERNDSCEHSQAQLAKHPVDQRSKPPNGEMVIETINNNRKKLRQQRKMS